MNCIIIEDQRPAQEILEKYIADLGSLHLVGTFTDAIKALEALNEIVVDLIFLDIHLPRLSGIDFLKTLKKQPKVILTTAFPDYALESYELDAVDYLLKPFSFQRFVKAVSKAQLMEKATKELASTADSNLPKEIFIKSGYDLIHVYIDDIYYLRSDSDYTEIHLLNGKHLSKEPLKHWDEKLKVNDFVRIHKSYIVNFARIKKVSANQAYLSNGTILPIGRAYKDEFALRLQR